MDAARLFAKAVSGCVRPQLTARCTCSQGISIVVINAVVYVRASSAFQGEQHVPAVILFACHFKRLLQFSGSASAHRGSSSTSAAAPSLPLLGVPACAGGHQLRLPPCMHALIFFQQ